MSVERIQHTHQPDDQGFILVGVVMFVLALTILGMSLFSLSGYEAQFLGQSMRRTQAFYDALGGIDRSLRVLSETNDMNAVTANLPTGLIYARAWQGDDSTAVDWQDTTWIRVRVVAERGVGSDVERRMLEGLYRHTGGGDSHEYEEVIATTGKIWLQQYPQNHNSGALTHTTELLNVLALGRIRQNQGSTLGWINAILPLPALFGGGGVADPEIAEFISYWQAQAIVPDFDLSDDDDDDGGWGGGDEHTYELNGFPGPVGVFRAPNVPECDDHKDLFGFSDGCGGDIRIELGERKPVIWLLPDGGHFEQFVRVRDTRSGDALIIVAGTSADTTFRSLTGANLGLWFRGGIDCPVPLYLVSSGAVSIDHDNDWNDDASMNHVSIFAGGVHLRGPRRLYGMQSMVHVPSGDAMCDSLRANHYLPNTLPGSGGNVQFTLVSGTFQDPPTP